MNRFVDLSHTFEENMSVYPGTEPPVFKKASNIRKDGFSELKLQFYSHTGTHIDAPCHILNGAPSLSDINIEKFIGKGIVLPHNTDRALTVDDIQEQIVYYGKPDFILINTCWDKYWKTKKYFYTFPLPNGDVFSFLARLGLKGIGIDTVSVDEVGSKDFPNHKAILGSGAIIIENLTGLKGLIGKIIDLYCFPLKIINGDGAPVRAVAKYS